MFFLHFHNAFYQRFFFNSAEKKGNSLTNNNGVIGIGAVYKDIKPRVDTRWKKKDATAQISSSVASAQATAMPRPLSRQNSRANDLIKKELKGVGVNVKSITDKITMQLKKTTTITSTIDLKRTQKAFKEQQSDLPFIRSPASIKTKNTRKDDSGIKYFESHSTFLLHQVAVFIKP